MEIQDKTSTVDRRTHLIIGGDETQKTISHFEMLLSLRPVIGVGEQVILIHGMTQSVTEIKLGCLMTSLPSDILLTEIY